MEEGMLTTRVNMMKANIVKLQLFLDYMLNIEVKGWAHIVLVCRGHDEIHSDSFRIGW